MTIKKHARLPVTITVTLEAPDGDSSTSYRVEAVTVLEAWVQMTNLLQRGKGDAEARE